MHLRLFFEIVLAEIHPVGYLYYGVKIHNIAIRSCKLSVYDRAETTSGLIEMIYGQRQVHLKFYYCAHGYGFH